MMVAGIDEVGMGALAGPVVAAAVVFPGEIRLHGIRDSKQLTAPERERLVPYIQNKAIGWAIGEASVDEISQLNIWHAAHLAMRRAIEKLTAAPHMILVDGRPFSLGVPIPLQAIIKGDACCTSIAAASVLAKVYRDTIMRQLDEEYPYYGFARHKGYSTRFHLAALERYGSCIHHRPTYSPVAATFTHA
jgi:ribonuclease HII